MRQIINKNQTQGSVLEHYNGRNYKFNKDIGLHFSDHENMDNVVKHFLSLDGFELVGTKKTIAPAQIFKKQEKSSKHKFKKDKQNKKEE